MNILMVYGRTEYTTARYFEDVLRESKEHAVLTAGINATDIKTDQNIVVPSVLNAQKQKCDLVFVMEGQFPMNIFGIEDLNIPTVYYGIDTHMHKEHSFREAMRYQNVFFAQKKGVEEYKKETDKKNVYWLPCCAEPTIHMPLDVPVTHDVAFVGGIDLKEVHLERRKLLCSMIDAGHKVLIGKAMGLFMSYVYAKAKSVFNVAVKDDLNMRVFEAMACKKPLITNKLGVESGFSELFTAGEDYLEYSNQEELLEKVKYLLAHEEEIKKIAEKGYKKVIEKHTYKIRVKEMIWQINQKKN